MQLIINVLWILASYAPNCTFVSAFPIAYIYVFSEFFL